MKDLMTFSNEKFGTVRTVKIENEVWFVEQINRRLQNEGA